MIRNMLELQNGIKPLIQNQVVMIFRRLCKTLYAIELQIENFLGTGGFDELKPLSDDPEARLKQKQEATRHYREY